MLAVLLAGGLGKRLRPLTTTTPKPLLPVANRPLLDHALERLPPEVDEVVLATGYRSGDIERYLRAAPRRVRVRVAAEDKPLGTGGAIRNALEHAGGARGTFLVRNADLIDTLPVAAMLEAHRRGGALATISLWEVEDPSPFGVARLRGDRIQEFVEKPRREEAPSRLANAGTYILEPEVLSFYPGSWEGELSIERTVFPRVVATARGMRGFPFRGHWVDCGRPDTYLEAHRLLLPRGATLGPGATCDGQVKGFACLGPGAAVEEGAAVEDSVLLEGARVGRNAILVRSVLGAGARVGEGARLEDTVLGERAEVPGGARLRGARVPEVEA